MPDGSNLVYHVGLFTLRYLLCPRLLLLVAHALGVGMLLVFTLSTFRPVIDRVSVTHTD